MNGHPERSFHDICEFYTGRVMATLAESRELPGGIDEIIATEIGHAMNEYVTRYTDRIDRIQRVIQGGGSFGLTSSQRRILLEAMEKAR